MPRIPSGYVPLLDFARKAGVGHWAVRTWVRDGKVKAVRVGMGRGRLYIRVADLRKLRARPVVPKRAGVRKARRKLKR